MRSSSFDFVDGKEGIYATTIESRFNTGGHTSVGLYRYTCMEFTATLLGKNLTLLRKPGPPPGLRDRPNRDRPWN
jgi:hypothetical protein